MAGFIMAFSGCTPEAKYTFNAVYALNQERESGVEFDEARAEEIGNLLTALFGTPDEPHVPNLGELDVQQAMDLHKLKLAAGPVSRDSMGRVRGLYREHCAHCHGVTGDGAGPTAAFLKPYPRDYRLGLFKFKSTPRGYRPTHEDLKRTLVEGIPGTAMPSFKVLPENEIEALVHYVRYLSIRGEVERRLMNFVALDLDEEEPLVDLDAPASEQADQAAEVRFMVQDVVQRWLDSEEMATEVPAPDPDRDLAESIERGKVLFYSQLTGSCAKCHGDAALGDGQTTDYDDWAKELDPENPDRVNQYVELGALPPRNIEPRNLRRGVYRGGRRPIDLYWRIRNGIEGTPMPAASMKPEGAPDNVQGLTPEDIWSLVDYVRSLPYESISKPKMPEPHYQRERL